MRPGCYSMQSALLGLILWTIASPAIAAAKSQHRCDGAAGGSLSRVHAAGAGRRQCRAVLYGPVVTVNQSENGSRPRPRGFRCRVCAPPRRPCWRGQRVRQLVCLSATKEGRQDNYLRLLLVGVRGRVIPPAVGGRKATGVRIFGQLLAGTEWSSVFGGRRAIQPGGGIDARIRDACVVRVQLDYTFVPGELRNLSGSRVLVGLVYGFGSREP